MKAELKGLSVQLLVGGAVFALAVMGIVVQMWPKRDEYATTGIERNAARLAYVKKQ